MAAVETLHPARVIVAFLLGWTARHYHQEEVAVIEVPHAVDLIEEEIIYFRNKLSYQQTPPSRTIVNSITT